MHKNLTHLSIVVCFFNFSTAQLPVPALFVFAHGFFSNPPVFIGIGILLMLQACFIYLPQLQTLFNSGLLDGRAWMLAMAVGAIVLPIISLDKWIRRSADGSTQAKEIR